MSQQHAIAVENSFVKGVVTEATALNFPEQAVTESYDCIFEIDGSIYRRTGIDFETNFETKTINRNNKVIKTYLWQNVAGNGSVTVVVAQIGDILYFWETDGTGIFSTGAQVTTVTLNEVSGAPDPSTVEAQFCDGNGYLIVTHPYCDPIRISYDAGAHTATATTITLQIRDFEGDLSDPYGIDTRPTSTLAALNDHHEYNLYNQGWTSTTLTAWDTAQTTMPSNADQPWRFKDASNNLDYSSASVARISSGNTPAPKGHFVLNLALQDRNAIIAGAVNTDTGFQRPSACAFFAGRVWYAGINYQGFNSNIYFTQTIERVSQYGSAYQVNDPTSEDLFDLLPTDGGVISIPEAGTVYKMFTVPGGLCVFAANGVWFITGSTGLGFTATDYAVLKIADIPTIGDASFVNVMGFPAWWNTEGIYIMAGGQNLPQVKSLTWDTFKTFYDQIPVTSKRWARGFYDKTEGHVRWIYKSENTTNLNETYEYDRVLNFNVRTGAFYPWTISDSNVKVHSILSTELITRPIDLNLVTKNNLVDLIVDSSGNQVISFSASGSADQQFDKFFVSYPDGSSNKFTFANRTDNTYKDWESYEDIGIDYTSYVVTGFKMPGQGLRRTQNNWVQVYSRIEDPVTYRFQALWDFANTGSGTGRWSTNQLVSHTDTNYSNASRRLKVRGHGKALQFRLSSIPGEPFDIIGWSSLQSTNGAP